ncbi:MAG: STAS domain-containing protein [Actinomycetota bacterium]
MSNSEKESFSIRAERRDGVARISAYGELDLETVPLLERTLEAVDHLEPARVVIDFTDLSFVDSTGVHAILRAHTRATKNGNVLVVVNSSENVRKVFELTRTEHLFEAAISDDPTVAEFDDERGWLPIAIPEVGDG